MKNKKNQSNPRVGIIADDLTGAADSGIQFAVKGYETKLLFDIPKEETAFFDEVTVINTNSRDLIIKEAYSKAFYVANILKQNKVNHLIKKIDSTLRGNWEAEIQAIVDVHQPELVIIAPAYPVMGRTTVKGTQYINGIPIHESESANDPKFPISNSNIVDILKQQLDSQSTVIENITVKELREDHDDLWKSMLQSIKHKGKTKYLIFDTQDDADLKQVVNYFTNLKEFKILWVGTAGIAQYLPDILVPTKKPTFSIECNSDSEPVLVVTGSKTSVTKNQIKELTSNTNVLKVEFDPLKIFDNEEINSYLIQQSYHSLMMHKDVVLCIKNLSSQQQAHLFELGDFYGYSNIEIGNKMVDQLGEITKGIMEKIHLKNLVLIGGDTAMAVCKALGVSSINLMKEIEPGIPLGQFIGNNNIKVVTKSGGFGDDKSLVNVVNTLKGAVK